MVTGFMFQEMKNTEIPREMWEAEKCPHLPKTVPS